MPAPISSLLMPNGFHHSRRVNNTTTSSGTRKMRPSVIVLGRFTLVSTILRQKVTASPPPFAIMPDCHEGDSAGRRQGFATPSPDAAHAEADRADLRSALSAVSNRSDPASPRNQRDRPQPQLPAAAH